MLMPKRVKYRKAHRGRMRGAAHAGTSVTFGEFGLQAQDRAWVTSQQIEAARRAITRFIKRGGKLWIRIFPDHPVTKKPAETRMGSGKGNPELWVAVVRPGRVLFELGGVSEAVAREAMTLAGHKLPIPTRFVHRDGFGETVGQASPPAGTSGPRDAQASPPAGTSPRDAQASHTAAASPSGT